MAIVQLTLLYPQMCIACGEMNNPLHDKCGKCWASNQSGAGILQPQVMAGAQQYTIDVQSSSKEKNAPIKKRSAYNYFLQEQRSEISKTQPHLSFGEIATIVSKNWKKLTAVDSFRKPIVAISPLP